MVSKFAIFVAAFAVVNANILMSAPLVNTGISTSTRKQDAMGNYAFSYGMTNKIGASNSRAKAGDAHGNKQGTYTITDIDGRARRVDYVADALGFRASVKTNEPGTALSAPAAAMINSPYASPVGPAVADPIVAAAPLMPAATVSMQSSIIGHGAVLGMPLGVGIIGAQIGKGLVL